MNKGKLDCKKRYAEVSWTIEDVQTAGRKMGLEINAQSAEDFMCRFECDLRDGLISEGWRRLEWLITLMKLENNDKKYPTKNSNKNLWRKNILLCLKQR